MCVVGAITGFGVLLVVGKTIAQAMTSPQLVTDYENREGVTVIAIKEIIRNNNFLNVSISYRCLLRILTKHFTHSQSSSVLEEYSIWQCYKSGSTSFFFDLIIFIYLGLLQLVGIILAFQTRKVKIPILNDSKSVATLIYISSIVLVVIVLITFILRGYINVCATVFSGGIILLATFFLALIFIPKVRNVEV